MKATTHQLLATIITSGIAAAIFANRARAQTTLFDDTYRRGDHPVI